MRNGGDGNSFNPRTRVGCDLVCLPPLRWLIVSIHAPVWGATIIKIDARVAGYVSIHAPVWGAT